MQIHMQISSPSKTCKIDTLVQNQNSMSTLLERFSSQIHFGNASTPNNNAMRIIEIRLPPVNLPDFSGNILEWVRFKQLFETLVHERTNISDIEKFEYLSTKLKCEALSTIKHLKPTAANYSVAWQLLNQKYGKDDNIKSAYMELLFNQPVIKSATLSEIKKFHSNINEAYNALKSIDESTEQWSSALLFNIEKKLDVDTATLWFREKRKADSVKFSDLLKYLDDRVFELESLAGRNAASKEKKQHMNAFVSTSQVCAVCEKDHYIHNCDKFLKMSIEQRRDTIKKLNLCFNCLRNNHKYNDCKSRSCKKCGKKHNSLLHFPAQQQQLSHSTQKTVIDIPDQNEFVSNSHDDSVNIKHVNTNVSQKNERSLVILPTALVTVLNNHNLSFKCRALLDSGSQGTLISEECVQRLGLKRTFDKTIIFGLGNQAGKTAKGKVELKINAKSQIIATEALCLPNLTKILPTVNINNSKFDFFSKLELADPHFDKEAKIDIILGADMFIECCLPEKIIHPSGSPAALNTIFGWVIMGKTPSSVSNHISSNHISINLDEYLQQFWQVENVPEKQQLTVEEEAAEKYYQQTTTRLKDGRYEVRLPLKNQGPHIGESKTIAIKRLAAMENRFKLNQKVESDYKIFINEYIQLGHMKEIKDEPTKLKCFLPHHAVMKPSSTTSKIRVVFDASCKTTNGFSLNDNLLVGPKVQRDLFDLLINFRLYQIAYASDIEKMYRQVSMNADDRFLQCIVWRDNVSEEVKEYTLNTVTYGTAAASFLATRTLKQVAEDNKKLEPATAKAIRENFYVDDFMHSSQSIDRAIKVKNELNEALTKAGFHLRKWSSNSAAFLNTIPPQDRAVSLDTEIQNTSTVPTLGLIWNTQLDFFKFTNISQIEHKFITKRIVLSEVAKIYDPMGWLSPTVIHMKIFMQKLWLRGIGWDEQLTIDLHSEWKQIRNDINALPTIKINRWIDYNSNAIIELHGFSDASDWAYSAAIYVKVYYNNQEPYIHLIAAKTRVAPVKQVTIPRLELCAAHLMVNLITRVRDSLGLSDIAIFGWTDSTIVLSWISHHPRKWKTFIANRTSEIISALPAKQWRHIGSKNNPADLATRGISAEALANNSLWWHGPDILRELNPSSSTPIEQLPECNLEKRQNITVNSAIIQEKSWIEQFSCRNKLKQFGFITMIEYRNAHNHIIKLSQQTSFPVEIKLLAANKQLTTTHPLSSVSPFIDREGLLRVGGRLNNANINYDQRHPIILNKNQHLTKVIIRHYHIVHCHAGKRLIHYIIQLKYWCPAISSVIRAVVYKCSICMRHRALPYQQKMGELPKFRVNPAAVFSKIGIDFAGPFHVRAWKGRGGKTYKCWLAIFVCLVTKALHIEVVSELLSTAFIASLRRFIARRGKPLHIYTDNGTNFVGANNYLKEIYKFLEDQANQNAIQAYLVEQQINWHFIPPAGPNFGGLLEAGVKSIKFHLHRVLKEAHPTFEEMYTLLCQIESCLNSRPLCIKYEGDIDPLTPAHFIILRPMAALPEENLDNLKENRLTRWQYIQRLLREFWKKWSLQYLNQLQQRNKWKQAHDNLSVNDVVVIKDENAAPSHWLMGSVTELHPGADGLVRVATLKTKNGFVKRPICKLCPLFQDIES